MDANLEKELGNRLKDPGFKRGAIETIIEKWDKLSGNFLDGLDFNQLLEINQALGFWMNPFTRAKIRGFVWRRAFELMYLNEELTQFLTAFPESEKEKELVEKIFSAKNSADWLEIYQKTGNRCYSCGVAPINITRRAVLEALRFAKDFKDYNNINQATHYSNHNFCTSASRAAFDKMCELAKKFEEWNYLYQSLYGVDPRADIFLTQMSETATTFDQLLTLRSRVHYPEDKNSLRQQTEQRIVGLLKTFEDYLLAYQKIVDRETTEDIRKIIEQNVVNLATTPDQILSLCCSAEKDSDVRRITYEKLLNLKEIPSEWITNLYQGNYKGRYGEEASQIILALIARSKPCVKPPEALPGSGTVAIPQFE